MSTLVYFTLGNNKEYIKLLELCLKSLSDVGYYGDYLVITDTEYQRSISEGIKTNNRLHFMTSSSDDLKSSSANKLKIYQFPLAREYDKIIYSDVDMIWLKHPDLLLEHCNEDKIHLGSEKISMSDGHFGGLHFTAEEKDFIQKNGILGLNAGLFFFKSAMTHHFEKMDEYFMKNQNLMECCLEQPYINVYLFRNKLYDSGSATGKIVQNGYGVPPEDLSEKVVIHFHGWPGRFDLKYDNMISFLTRNNSGNWN